MKTKIQKRKRIKIQKRKRIKIQKRKIKLQKKKMKMKITDPPKKIMFAFLILAA